MDKAQLLDKLLSNTCPKVTMEDGSQLYMFDLHCGTAEIIARAKNKVVDDTGDYQYSTFDIINVEWK